MVIFEYFLKTRSDQNIHQNAPNCTILKNFLGGACPRTPLAKRMALPCAACRFVTCKFPNLKKKILGPPPPNPGDAPAHIVSKETNLRGLHIVSGETDLRRAPYIL